MRQVVPPADHRAPAGQPPGHADERRVENRDEQDEERNRRDGYDAGLQSRRRKQRASRQEGPEKQAAAVAHEDRRRPDVVDQEPERGADERGDGEQSAGTLPAGDMITRKKVPAMAAMPADSPSMLSSRLKALVMPTIQMRDRSASSGAEAGDVRRRHAETQRPRR